MRQNLRKPAQVLSHIFVLAFAAILFAENQSLTMKAIVIHEYGGPEVLKYEDVPIPEPKEDQILIRVIAAGVNPVDGMIRAGMFSKNAQALFSRILGGDVAGVDGKSGPAQAARSGCLRRLHQTKVRRARERRRCGARFDWQGDPCAFLWCSKERWVHRIPCCSTGSGGAGQTRHPRCSTERGAE